ncbi:RNA-directed DNA polymerase [Rosistilla oblonga]|uniref:RNA-directed DNA polymerase n=1 Tax=Rosistilla oblonga TaxID=2527990 RepID=UPI003A979340
MHNIEIRPEYSHLSNEYLIVAAWKKAHDYIRRHNWYSDVLELDLTNAAINKTVDRVTSEFSNGTCPTPRPIRLVLAPKSQQWEIKNQKWQPIAKENVRTKLRPLAHPSVRDQIISTAMMILVADPIETAQGDPRQSIQSANEKGMVSYGNRLFCDNDDGLLNYRWGNSTVYREYFQDYQTFIRRPQAIVADTFLDDDTAWAVVTADLSQFYDRVRPSLLHAKLAKLLGHDADAKLLDAFTTFFNWSWHADDEAEALKYAANSSPVIEGCDQVALPQGLVSSGFFANLVLLDFDRDMVGKYKELCTGEAFGYVDYCRYVDDMRFVVRLNSELAAKPSATQEQVLKDVFSDMLKTSLDQHAPGLLAKQSKLSVLLGTNASGGSTRFSMAMNRINRNASGVVDMFRGEETLDLIEGLFYSTRSKPLELGERFEGTILDSQPDVREETVSRFAAHRFRTAYRTLRPMSEPETDKKTEPPEDLQEGETDWNGRSPQPTAIGQATLDAKAEHFSGVLIERWVRDPSSMRILRVALDINPSVANLDLIVDLMKDHLSRRKSDRRTVVLYCAAEILKAGATETGLVDDVDKLPRHADLSGYQSKLAELAEGIVANRSRYPWYVLQQAQLFLACLVGYESPKLTSTPPESERQYILLRQVCNGSYHAVPGTDVSAFACLHSQLRSPDKAAIAFLQRWRSGTGVEQQTWLMQILEEQQRLARATWNIFTENEKGQWRNLFENYGVLAGENCTQSDGTHKPDVLHPLLDVACSSANPFRQDYALVWLAKKLIPLLVGSEEPVTPNRVCIKAPNWETLKSENFPLNEGSFQVELRSQSADDIRFRLPAWIPSEHRWAYQLGMLLRVMLTGKPDYTQDCREFRPRSNVMYRPYRSSWLRRRYGMFNGRSAFGPAWMPVSPWIGDLLTVLLRWPGFPKFDSLVPTSFTSAELLNLLQSRLNGLEHLYGTSSKVSIIPIRVPKKAKPKQFGLDRERNSQLMSMRVAVAQTAIPRHADFANDLQLNDPDYRRRHRRHAASVLAAVENMLQVRTTHVAGEAGIELLVLPELALHPDDVNTLVMPFVRRNRCMVCTGVGFHPVSATDPRKINVAAWLIPMLKRTGGLHIEQVYQGKHNLTQEEIDLQVSPFRPAQWVFWLVDPLHRTGKLWSMSSAICYDATDLSLAADLRDRTEMFVVPALNQDVGTFDNMASALHYHMFQHVVVANTGEFGGSSAHAPFKNTYQRTIFHAHGNEQVAIGFFELDFDLYNNGRGNLKTPPANLNRL